MKRFLKCFGLSVAGLMAVTTGFAKPPQGFETRCGWFANPTPGNITLSDRDGVWLLGSQGTYEVADWNDWPDFGSEWVNTNGHYGYGCACMDVKVNRKEKEVTSVRHMRVRPLATCREDNALSQWTKEFSGQQEAE